MKISNHLLIIFLTLSKIHGIQLPVNSSDRSTISNWVIAKIEDVNSQQINSFKDNPKEFFNSLPEDKIRDIYLSSYNDVTLSLYQLYDKIDFKSVFMIACVIESKNDQTSGFYYEDYDIDATVYINGTVAMSQELGDERYFEHKLKKGANTVLLIGKPTGRYTPAFNLFIYDEKMAQLDIKILNQKRRYHRKVVMIKAKRVRPDL